jgi:hypothetical protein
VRLERLDGGGIVDVARDEVIGVQDLDDLRADLGGPPDPARGRHLAITAALPLLAGEVRAASTAAEPLLVSVGLGHGLEVTGAVAAPLFVGETSPASTSVDASWNCSFSSWLHGGAGVRVTREGGGTTGVAHLSLTAGSRGTHVTFYAGPPLPGASWLGHFSAVVAGGAGTWRFGRRVALLGETWFELGSSGSSYFAAGGLRFLPGGGLALDAGALSASERSLAPWLAITWSTGGAP